ncbi:MAG: GTP pyrophosphokinase family protein [Lachnospirales bacterium]
MNLLDWKTELLPFEQAMDELVTKFNGMKRDFLRVQKQSPIEQVTGRVKTVASIIEKANRRRIPLDKALVQLEDIVGIRIICRFVQDIDKVVQIIRGRSAYDMKILQEEDYINNVKASGYRSYHITIEYPIIQFSKVINIKCEIQIRTLAMNFWATIEHSMRYKFNGKVPDDIKNRLISCSEAAFNLDKEMSKIRQDLFEARDLTKDRDNIVDSVIENIHALSLHISADQMSEFNYQFLQLYQEGNIQKLSEFNSQLTDLIKEY